MHIDQNNNKYNTLMNFFMWYSNIFSYYNNKLSYTYLSIEAKCDKLNIICIFKVVRIYFNIRIV